MVMILLQSALLVTSVLAFPEELIFAVGVDTKLYKQAMSTLSTSSPWHVANIGSMDAVAISNRWDTIYCVDSHKKNIWMQKFSTMTKTSTWHKASAGMMESIAISGDTIYNVDFRSKKVFKQVLSTMTTLSAWMPASSGSMKLKSIAISGDTIYGVALNSHLYKQTLSTMTTSSAWMLASSGQMDAVAMSGSTVYCLDSVHKNVWKQPLTTMTPSSPWTQASESTLNLKSIAIYLPQASVQTQSSGAPPQSNHEVLAPPINSAPTKSPLTQSHTVAKTCPVGFDDGVCLDNRLPDKDCCAVEGKGSCLPSFSYIKGAICWDGSASGKPSAYATCCIYGSTPGNSPTTLSPMSNPQIAQIAQTSAPMPNAGPGCLPAESGVCTDAQGNVDLQCCAPPGQGRCVGDFVYSKGAVCGQSTPGQPQSYATCCGKLEFTTVEPSSSEGSEDVVGSIEITTHGPSKGTAIGVGVAAGAGALAAVGVTIAELVKNKGLATTALQTPAKPGDSTLNVLDPSQFHIGDPVSIGGISVRKVTGFGSIILSKPLTKNFPAGTRVVKLPASYGAAPITPAAAPITTTNIVGALASLAAPSTTVPQASPGPTNGIGKPAQVVAGIAVVCTACALLSLCVVMCIYFCLPGTLPGTSKRDYGGLHDMDGMEHLPYSESAPTMLDLPNPNWFAYQPVMNPTDSYGSGYGYS